MTPGGLLVLLAEDDSLSRKLLQSYLEHNGHQVIAVVDGAEAVDAFAREQPDLVILDVVMPTMDGIEACKQIKQLMGDRWVPIMMVSSNSDEQAQVMGIDVGADYYLTKPISFAILQAQLMASQRIAGLHRELEARNAELSAYYAMSESENELAQEMIDRILKISTTEDTHIHQSVRPLERFSGDVVAIVNSHSGNTYAMLADATGHGLPAAITLMPAMELFYQMSRRGYGISTIARYINRRLKELLPASQFLAAILVLINPQRHTLHIWNGGCPTAYVLTPEGHLNHKLSSAHPPLGVLEDSQFDETATMVSADTNDRLVACTDGLIEARNETGELFGKERLIQVLQSCTDDSHPIDSIQQALSEFSGTTEPVDDQSLLVLTVAPPLEKLQVTDTGISNEPAMTPENDALAGWDFELGLRGAEVARTEIVPTVTQLLENLRLPEMTRRRAFVVLTELINNAVDHGLLQLESAAKKGPDGFEHYIIQREEALANLKAGFIRVLARRTNADGRSLLRFMVIDSGRGFNTNSYTDFKDNRSDDDQAFGRGIRLVASMVDNLRFLDNGARIEVEILIEE